MKRWGIALALGALALCGAPAAFAQGDLQGSISEIHAHAVSAAATAVSVIVDTRNLHSTLAIEGSCSAGTATLVVSGDQVSLSDTASALTLDSISAASPQTKQYTPTTVGASIALSPLAFRWLTVTLGTCGSSNTGTLDVGMK